MKLNPHQAPLYGECLLTVQLCDEELVQGAEHVEFFLLFAGTTQRHLTSTLKVSHATLQAVCPAHDCCESVLVTLCLVKPGGSTDPVARERFQFVQDLAFDMAQFLVSTAGREDGLDGALLLDECQIPLQECERLDRSLALALRHLPLPRDWSLLGNNSEAKPQETLLHFAARRGLCRVAGFLLEQPGGREALALPNKEGATPANIAESRGHGPLLQLFSQEETAAESRTETLRQIYSGARVVEHHPSLNTYTLTLGTEAGSQLPCLQSDIKDLLHLILCHAQGKGGALLQLQSESLYTTQECGDSLETEKACLERPQQDSLDTREQRFAPVGVKANKSESTGPSSPLENRESDGVPSLAPKDSEACSDNCISEHWVCLCQNIDTDCKVQREAAACVEDSRVVQDSSDSLQSRPEGDATALGAPSCGAEREETDTAQDLICAAQGSSEGPGREHQEGECTAESADKELPEREDPCALSDGAAAADMGLTQSVETSETSDTESKEGSQEAETGDENEAEGCQEQCSSPQPEGEEQEENEEPSDTNTAMKAPLRPSLLEVGDGSKEVKPDSVCSMAEASSLHEVELTLGLDEHVQNLGSCVDTEVCQPCVQSSSCTESMCSEVHELPGAKNANMADAEASANVFSPVSNSGSEKESFDPLPSSVATDPGEMPTDQTAELSAERGSQEDDTVEDGAETDGRERIRDPGCELRDANSGMTHAVSSDSFQSVCSSSTDTSHLPEQQTGADAGDPPSTQEQGLPGMEETAEHSTAPRSDSEGHAVEGRRDTLLARPDEESQASSGDDTVDALDPESSSEVTVSDCDQRQGSPASSEEDALTTVTVSTENRDLSEGLVSPYSQMHETALNERHSQPTQEMHPTPTEVEVTSNIDSVPVDAEESGQMAVPQYLGEDSTERAGEDARTGDGKRSEQTDCRPVPEEDLQSSPARRDDVDDSTPGSEAGGKMAESLVSQEDCEARPSPSLAEGNSSLVDSDLTVSPEMPNSQETVDEIPEDTQDNMSSDAVCTEGPHTIEKEVTVSDCDQRQGSPASSEEDALRCEAQEMGEAAEVTTVTVSTENRDLSEGLVSPYSQMHETALNERHSQPTQEMHPTPTEVEVTSNIDSVPVDAEESGQMAVPQYLGEDSTERAGEDARTGDGKRSEQTDCRPVPEEDLQISPARRDDVDDSTPGSEAGGKMAESLVSQEDCEARPSPSLAEGNSSLVDSDLTVSPEMPNSQETVDEIPEDTQDNMSSEAVCTEGPHTIEKEVTVSDCDQRQGSPASSEEDALRCEAQEMGEAAEVTTVTVSTENRDLSEGLVSPYSQMHETALNERHSQPTQEMHPTPTEVEVTSNIDSVPVDAEESGQMAVPQYLGEDSTERAGEDARTGDGKRSEQTDCRPVPEEDLQISPARRDDVDDSTPGSEAGGKMAESLVSQEDCEARPSPSLAEGNSSLVDSDLTVSPEMPNLQETVDEIPEDTQDNMSSEAVCTEGPHTIEKEAGELTGEDAVVCLPELSPGVGTDASAIHREKDTGYAGALNACAHPRVLEKGHSLESTESSQSQSPAHRSAGTSTARRDSGSDTDGFCSTDTGEDIFRKGENGVTGDSASEVSVSCSSTDDAASVGRPSSSPEGCVEGRSWSSEEARQRGGAGGGEAEEAEDRVADAPLGSAVLRSDVRSLSPTRRHSWGPGKNPGGEAEMSQCSSIRSLGGGKPTLHRRSLSWCPSEAPLSPPDLDQISNLSYSLEGLAVDGEDGKRWIPQGGPPLEPRRVRRQESDERGSLVSLTEEEHESDLGDCSSQKSRRYRPVRHSCPSMTLPLTKSVSMLSISQRDTDAAGRTRRKRRISFAFSISPSAFKSKRDFSIDSSSSDDEGTVRMSSFSSSSTIGYSITEEEPGPLRGDFEGKTGTKVSRTFSYLKSKMYKKTREKDKDRSKGKDREAKEREKRTVNGHLFSAVNSTHPALCHQCSKAINTKDAFLCTNCSACVHKGCRENVPVCAKVKTMLYKQQFAIPESTTMPAVTLRTRTTPMRDRPWSAILAPDDHSLMIPSRRHTSVMPFNSSNLSKSISISNIAVPAFDDIPLRKYLSQSTDSLQKTNKVNESTESLIDEGTEMVDGQLMGDFEADAKELEADSWSFTMDKKYLKQLKKDVIKRQDVIYELIQTEMHHLRTLRIMADVYSKGLLRELHLEARTAERVFPVLDELLELHTRFFSALLERKREARQEGTDGGFVIPKITDILIAQFSGPNAECMKKVYGKFCSRHNEAVNFYKELHAKDKRFQAFVKKMMSSSIVRRLGIPECILLVTQRITKYPVLMQRILQHTRENEEEYDGLTQALKHVKEVIAAVDSKVNEHEKKKRLKEIYGRTDSKSIMRMKSGQMFAREDLVRSRKLLHDGPLQLKNAAGRLKDVHAMLLSDVFVFLQEKDQKYSFASLDQRSTVISLQKLIVREVANEERGLFLITAGIEKPEMVEVHASTKEERNTWMQLLQDAMHSIEKDEDEGIPSETEEDKRLLESKAKEMRELLQRKDDQIVALLQDKMKLFRDMCECGSPTDSSSAIKMLFRASNDDVPKGEPIMKDALREVETMQTLVNGSLGGAVGQQVASAQETACSVGPVCLPRRAETFGGFDSHQMNISKSGDKEESEDTADLRRTESDSVLKKGGNANLLLLLKKNSEQVLHSVTHLHDLLTSLQAVVVQQDTFIEDQRQALSERPASRPSSRPSSLIEQEKQRSLEKHRQEAASLQRQQAAHADERRRREREWDAREQQLVDREALLRGRDGEAQRGRRELEETRRELLARKEDYQRDLERLRDAQRKLERDREQVHRELECQAEKRMHRTPSSTSEDSLKLQSSSSLEREPGEGELPAASLKNSLSRMDSKQKGRCLNPFASGHKAQSSEGQNQIPSRLLQLAKAKEKKEKKKKKGKTQHTQEAESHLLPLTEPPMDGEIFFC